LERYLSYAQVSSGQAIAAAREDYKNISRNRQMFSSLPEAWSKLVSEEDEHLLELLADKVESLCGFKPDLDTVAKFLRENVQLNNGIQERERPIQVARPLAAPAPIELKPQGQSISSEHAVGFTLEGKFHPCRNGREVLVGVFEALSVRDVSFLERFASRPKHGRTRRYLARSPAELYPGRPDLAAAHFSKLKSGWFVGTNVSRAQIQRIAEMACEVARLRFGRELTICVGE